MTHILIQTFCKLFCSDGTYQNRLTVPSFYLSFLSEVLFCFIYLQDDGLPENEHQLSVAGKIKKHFNTGPKPNSTAAGVSVIAVSI